MSLGYILKRVEADAGISSPDLNPEQRDWLVDIVNEAAGEIYDEEDLPLALQECYIKPTSGTRISLPPFVGEIRAIRSKRYNDLWKLSDIRARYNSTDWPEKWNKGRVIGILPIAVEVTNEAPGSVNVAAADPTLVVTLTGQTDVSNNDVDSITCTDLKVDGQKSFTSFRAISKNKIIHQDVIIKDADGQEIAIIYADQKESRYLLMDISKHPNISDCADGTFVMEVLFKPRLPQLYFDEDTFPVPDFDDVVILRTRQLLAELKPGQEQRAILMFQKGQRKINKKTDNRDGTIEKRLGWERNPLHGLYRRGRFFHRGSSHWY